MRSFPANFTTEKNKITGASPRWILVMRFATGTKYLSDTGFTITGWTAEGSPTTSALINEWGTVDNSVSDEIDAATISDFTAKIINEQSVGNILSILSDAANNPQQTNCELYLWFIGLNASTDPPQKIWQGNILDWDIVDDLTISILFQDEFLKADKSLGEILNKQNYPHARVFTALQPDNVTPDNKYADTGKVIPIVIWKNDNVNALCVKTPNYFILKTNILPGDTIIEVMDISGLPKTFPFFAEVDYWAPGVGGLGYLVFQITGQGTNDNLYVISLPAAFTGTHQSGTICYTLPDYSGPVKVSVSSEIQNSKVVFIVSNYPIKEITKINYKNVADGKLYDDTSSFNIYAGGDHPLYPGKAVIESKSTYDWSKIIYVNCVGIKDDASGTYTGHPNRVIARIDHVIKYLLHKEINIAPTLFNSSAEFADTIDTSILISGHKDIWSNVSLGLKCAALDPTTGLVYKCGGAANIIKYKYDISGVINSKKNLKDFINRLSLYARCYFFFSSGKPTLSYRPDILVSQKTLTRQNIKRLETYASTLKPYLSNVRKVINKITIHYDYDLFTDSYKQSTSAQDTASISKYGERENTNLWFFDFLHTPSATDPTGGSAPSLNKNLRDFYLARFKNRHNGIKFDTFLDQVELQRGDIITLEHPLLLAGRSTYEVKEVDVHPGSVTKNSIDSLTITAEEY